MATTEVLGHWWLPETPDHKVAGTLTTDDDGTATLALHGALRRDIEGMGPGRPRRFPRVLGRVGLQREPYTLDNVQESSWQAAIGFEIAQYQKVRATRVFIGDHFSVDDPYEFTAATLKISGLADFARMNGIDGDELVRLNLTAESVPDVAFTGLDGSAGTLVHDHGYDRQSFARYVIWQDCYAHLQYDEAQPVQRIIDAASHLQDLVTIATGRRALFERIALIHPRPELSDDASQEERDQCADGPYRDVELRAMWSVRADPRVLGPLADHDVTFTLIDLGAGDGLSRWLSVADRYKGPLGQVMTTWKYTDTITSPDLVMNAAAALEGFHKTWTSGRDAWFRVRIGACVALAGEQYVELVGDATWFTDILAKHRNNIAHGDAHLDSLEQPAVGRAASWLLVFCLLREAQAPETVFIALASKWRALRLQLEALRSPIT